jgi:hypothetical protein
MPPPPWRRAGCDEPSYDGRGHCFVHGLRYLLWLDLRADLERADLADSPRASYADLDDRSPLALAVWLTAFLFTPGLFS